VGLIQTALLTCSRSLGGDGGRSCQSVARVRPSVVGAKHKSRQRHTSVALKRKELGEGLHGVSRDDQPEPTK
jgi:hypothetical protein